MIEIVKLEQMKEDRLVKRVCMHGTSNRKKAMRKVQKKKAARTLFYSDLTIGMLAIYSTLHD